MEERFFCSPAFTRYNADSSSQNILEDLGLWGVCSALQTMNGEGIGLVTLFVMVTYTPLKFTMKPHTTKQFPTSCEHTSTFPQGALKLKDACRYLGNISPTSVRRLINRGQLKPNRTLRHLIFPISELDRFLGEVQQ
jgi:Helix-turn-helix domain